ncbi:MAG: hypothetical protein F4062_08070 [Acidimicrobiia bacterium]|nr:hypothetical protein [Acidimicrobiia bacterium]
MADKGDKRTYPRLPAKNWWTLRERFKQTMPGRVDADYLQSVLALTSAASAGNLIGPLRALGLIDEEGSPTDRALDWRQDDTYKDVCEAMLVDVYPDTLRAAFPDPSTDTGGVTSWFSRNTGAGQGAATGMAALYTLIAAADPGASPTNAAVTKATPTQKKAAAKKAAAKKATPKTPGVSPGSVDEGGEAVKNRRPDPELNINVQIHISPDASAEQVDQIFKSMAQHLYGGE